MMFPGYRTFKLNVRRCTLTGLNLQPDRYGDHIHKCNALKSNIKHIDL